MEIGTKPWKEEVQELEVDVEYEFRGSRQENGRAGSCLVLRRSPLIPRRSCLLQHNPFSHTFPGARSDHTKVIFLSLRATGDVQSSTTSSISHEWSFGRKRVFPCVSLVL